MKKIIISLLALVLIGTLGFGAMAVLASPKNIPVPKATVMEAAGEVQVLPAGAGEWRNVAEDMEIGEGDKIKTGDDGGAALNFYNGSVARIGANSEIVIDRLYLNENNYAQSEAGLTVVAGRVWSRILQLSDSKAAYEVRSDNTVATVRGTGFDFLVGKDGSTEITTTENSVSVAVVENGETKEMVKLPTGRSARIAKTEEGELELAATATPRDILESEWFGNNWEEDENFIRAIKEESERINREMAGILPDSALYRLKIAAEKAKLSLAGEDSRRMLEADFLARRLAEAQALSDAGKSGLAEDMIKDVVVGVKENFSGSGVSGNLPNQIWLQRHILDGVRAGEQGGSLKTMLEDIALDLAADDNSRYYLIFKLAQERLGEAGALKAAGEDGLADEQMAEYFRLVEILEGSGLPEADDWIETLDGIRESLFASPIETPVETEEPAEGDAVELLDIVPTETDTPTPSAPTVKEPVIPLETRPEPAAVQAETPETVIEPEKPIDVPAVLQSLKIVPANGNNMQANSTKQFTAMAVYSDGSEKAVTDSAAWSVSGDIGSINSSGLLRSDVDGGYGTVTAVYTENGVTVRGSSARITALTIEL